jgi:hypothetical protein
MVEGLSSLTPAVRQAARHPVMMMQQVALALDSEQRHFSIYVAL